MKKINFKKTGLYTLTVLLILAGIIAILEMTGSYKFSDKINTDAPVITKKSILINAPINKVWQVFTDVDHWSNWQKKIPTAKINGDFKAWTTFDWKTGGLTITSTLQSVEKNKAIAWCGPAFGSFAVHTWHFSEENGQTKVYVEESMEGWLVYTLKNQFQKTLDTSIEYWLGALKRETEK